MSDNLVTTEEAAVRLNVPANVIAAWKYHRRVTPAGFLRGRGRDAPTYYLDELKPLAEQYHQRQATRRSRRSGDAARDE